jgi:hypothetical protein
MRAREFITEQASLDAEQADPLSHTYILPGITANDPYLSYRMGVAIARARSDQKSDDINPYLPKWTARTPFGEAMIVAGVNNSIDPIIDTALKMADMPGGKEMVGSGESQEPKFVSKKSPIQAFKGYPR